MAGITVHALEGITSCTTYASGAPEDCRLSVRNVIETPYGDLVPRYGPPGIRSKELKSISFFESGAVRSIALEEQTDIQTPMGALEAELVTFYENGVLESVFPLNGQIGFGWSEQEERALAKAYGFTFDFGEFEAKVMALRFYPDGGLRSLLLWPGEVIRLDTPVGTLPVRIGFRLHENGALASVEPAVPVTVRTPIGDVNTFDVTALGIDSDVNSLRFDTQGQLSHLATSGDIVVHDRTSGIRMMFSSRTRIGLTSDDLVKLPIRLSFQGEAVRLQDGTKTGDFRVTNCSFLVLSDNRAADCGGECEGCEGCPG